MQLNPASGCGCCVNCKCYPCDLTPYVSQGFNKPLLVSWVGRVGYGSQGIGQVVNPGGNYTCLWQSGPFAIGPADVNFSVGCQLGLVIFTVVYLGPMTPGYCSSAYNGPPYLYGLSLQSYTCSPLSFTWTTAGECNPIISGYFDSFTVTK